MMLSNNSLTTHPVSFASARSAVTTTASVPASRFQGEEVSHLDALVESLMPEGVSANQRAVIERLISVWQAKAELDIA